jgi:hypothetical protein
MQNNQVLTSALQIEVSARLQKHFKLHLISWKAKIMLYKILAKLLGLGHFQRQNYRILDLSERRILASTYGGCAG